jgi:hypothetical protein
MGAANSATYKGYADVTFAACKREMVSILERIVPHKRSLPPVPVRSRSVEERGRASSQTRLQKGVDAPHTS